MPPVDLSDPAGLSTPAKSSGNISLDDKYQLVAGHAMMSGVQALVRLALDQRRLDRRAGLNTGGFISGYRGSPLGGLDQQLEHARRWLVDNDIEFWSGLNEDLGATAVWGSQQLGLYPGAKKDGLFGIWYGKAPGVDRTGDVFKHAHAAGTSRHGGVLAVLGDDHNCKSSTLPSQSEFAMADAEIPVLSPSNIQDVLDYGLHGLAMSRFTGGWSALTALADTMDSNSVIDVSLSRHRHIVPDFDFPSDGVHIRRNDLPLPKEQRLRMAKLPAAHAWVYANQLDRVILAADRPRFGIIVSGQAAQDVFEALKALGIDAATANALGLVIYKVAMPWPLEPRRLREVCGGLEKILVLEHKRPLMEGQIKTALFNLGDRQRPIIIGKSDEHGRAFLSQTGTISIPEMARALARFLPAGWDRHKAEAYFAMTEGNGHAAGGSRQVPLRSPHYCSGCPHSTSTRVPPGTRALAGIGCHYMANFMIGRRTDMTSQMGGEGVAWVGQHFATSEPHIFANIGDGTFSHSGSLAIRAALTSNANITFKILFNDAVAMTGGQRVELGLQPPQIAAMLRAEGVDKIVIIARDPGRYSGRSALPAGVKVYGRDQYDRVQEMLQGVPGVSVMIYDQVCAAEKRRRIKRGRIPPDRVRVMINPDVCEGCGDCSVKSNCLSVEPLETDLGRKRYINQSSCNTDLSCLDGFCPSFVTISNAEMVAKGPMRPAFDPDRLPVPKIADLDQPWNVLLIGIGGTGITTVALILAMAAHIDGNAASSLDMTGLAQKGGPVLSHLRFARRPEQVRSGRIPPTEADCLIACDLVVAAGDDAIALSNPSRTRVCANRNVAPTSEFIHNRMARFDAGPLLQSLESEAASLADIEAEALAMHYFGDGVFTNMIMAGYAWQMGQVPVSLEALFAAIKLNGVRIDDNILAFNTGRMAAAMPDQLDTLSNPRSRTGKISLDELIADRIERLTAYQNEAYAQIFQRIVSRVKAAEAALGTGEKLTRQAAFQAYKLMAYKDEYEVARLWSDSGFEAEIRKLFKGGTVRFHLAPPILPKKNAQGEPLKREFGPWMRSAFAGLKRFKWLRGTRFDPFGWTDERRGERYLRDNYLADLERVADELTPARYELALAIAGSVDEVRGFGHVKQAAIEREAGRRTALWQRWEQDGCG